VPPGDGKKREKNYVLCRTALRKEGSGCFSEKRRAQISKETDLPTSDQKRRDIRKRMMDVCNRSSAALSRERENRLDGLGCHRVKEGLDGLRGLGEVTKIRGVVSGGRSKTYLRVGFRPRKGTPAQLGEKARDGRRGKRL